MTSPKHGIRRSARKLHPRAAKIALLIFSTLFSLAAAEIALRVIQGGSRFTEHHQLFCEYHPVLGWQKKPNISGTHIGPEKVYQVRETMNSRGIRGPEYPYEKPPEEFRILALGDSFAEGYTVEFDELFSQVLKRLMNESETQPVEVINAGTGGYSTDQELLWFRTEGIKYSPDVVVLLFCSNDILFNTIDRYPRGFKPLFRVEGEELKLTNVPVPPPLPPTTEAPGSLPPAQPVSLHLRVNRWLYGSSYLYRNTRDTLLRRVNITALLVWVGIAEPRDLPANKSSSTPDAALVPDYIRFSDWNKATDEERRAGWKVTAALLRQLRTEVTSTGAELVVMVIPGNDEITRGVVAICTRNSIAYIDPTGRFRDAERMLKQQGKKLTFAPLDGHWNAEGHRLVGEILASYIKSKGYLLRKKRSETDRGIAGTAPNNAIDSAGGPPGPQGRGGGRSP